MLAGGGGHAPGGRERDKEAPRPPVSFRAIRPLPSPPPAPTPGAGAGHPCCCGANAPGRDKGALVQRAGPLDQKKKNGLTLRRRRERRRCETTGYLSGRAPHARSHPRAETESAGPRDREGNGTGRATHTRPPSFSRHRCPGDWAPSRRSLDRHASPLSVSHASQLTSRRLGLASRRPHRPAGERGGQGGAAAGDHESRGAADLLDRRGGRGPGRTQASGRRESRGSHFVCVVCGNGCGNRAARAESSRARRKREVGKYEYASLRCSLSSREQTFFARACARSPARP